MGVHTIPEGDFAKATVSLGENCYIVQGSGDCRDTIVLDKPMAAQLADYLAAWAHSVNLPTTKGKDDG